MPDQDFYEDLRSLRERIRRFAEHHYSEETRHISRFEYEMLLEAAALLPERNMTDEGLSDPH